MARAATILFSLFAYTIFFATFLYLIAFVGNIPPAAMTVDRGPGAPLALAAAIDIGLIALFGIQHSVMARQGFKRAWTQIVPKQAERSVYVLASSLVLIIMFAFWRPIPATLWHVEGVGAMVLWGLFGLGWVIVLASTFLINHFELFGLQQAWLHLRGRAAAAPQFRQPLFYKLVRHPLYTGFIIAFWSTPHMSVGHLLLALGMTAYIVIAIRYEERDLVGLFGKDYEDYQAKVGMLAPSLRGKSS